MPSGRSCVVPNCDNKRGTTGISLHEFPAEESLRKQWLKNISRGKDDNPSVPWIPTNDKASVCSAHFEVSDFRRNINTTRKLLKKNSVPTIFNYPSDQRIKPSFKRPPPKQRLLLNISKSKIPKIENPILSTDEDEQISTFENRESPGIKTETNGGLLNNKKNKLDTVQVQSLCAEDYEKLQNEWRKKQSTYSTKISRLTAKVEQLEAELESEKKKGSSKHALQIKKIVDASKEENTESMILIEQIEHFGKTAPQWSKFYLQKSSEWYAKSPSGYKLARSFKLFPLPVASTIRRFLEQDQPERNALALSDSPEDKEKWKMLWGNDLILHEITSYLSITDLKQLGCVDKYLLERVRTLSRFTSLACQIVTRFSHTPIFMSRAIVVCNKLSDDAVFFERYGAEMFKETMHLEFRDVFSLSSTKINSLIIPIVSNCKKLTSMKFGTFYHMKDDNESFLNDVNVKTRFANLRNLEIGPTAINYDARLAKWIKKHFDDSQKYKLFEEATKNMKLVKLTYSEPSEYINRIHPEFLLNNNRETLKELSIAIDLKQLKRLNAVQFPKLSKLELAVIQWYNGEGKQYSQSNYEELEEFPQLVIPFLRNHLSNLTEFQFGANYSFSLTPLCELLQDPTNTEKLKVLGFSSYFGFERPLSLINWNFLKTMSSLRYFKFNYQHQKEIYRNDSWSSHNIVNPDEWDDFGQFLPVIPSNIKSIEFRGLKFLGRQEDLLNTESSDLLRFKQLTELKIHCPSFFKDESLQFICKHLTKLKILEGDFTDVTRFGISGVNKLKNINTGICLAKLTELVELQITSCDLSLNLRLEDILKYTRFSNLVKLQVWHGTYRYCGHKFKAKHLLRLLSQNPCLERINLWALPLPKDCRKKVKKLHPRFNWC